MSEISIENTTATCGILWYEEVEVENTLHKWALYMWYRHAEMIHSGPLV